MRLVYLLHNVRAGRLEPVHVTDDGDTIYTLNRHPERRLVKDQAPRARKGPRFSPALLSEEARARWEQDNDLDWVQEHASRVAVVQIRDGLSADDRLMTRPTDPPLNPLGLDLAGRPDAVSRLL